MPVIGERVSISVKKILLATDFSSTSEKAASYARALARRFSSTVEIAHVFDPSVVKSYKEVLMGLPINERRRISNENLERLRDDFSASGIDARTISPEGHRPSAGLLRIAKEHEVDLIVAGTQSKSGVERLILGSTAEELIRNAKCPVLTVGPNAKPLGDAPLTFQTIVYATDFSAEAAKAAVYATSFAQDSGAHLYFCYVLQTVASWKREFVDGAFQSALKRMIPESSYDWCNPECVVEHGDAAKTILDLAERVQADLIVLGARKASFWLTYVERGVTPDLLAQAACPVMTVC
ncbi:universal stress protein [Edaphobacter aggregans]|uniref:universal stress protein n=1 Tax=Edaphobacter aggregans TaxID=570835 RepID=UPI00054D620A|nr:universal stress protein [Edaphobacter aggregans]